MIATGEASVSFDDLPAAPISLGVVHREEPIAEPPWDDRQVDHGEASRGAQRRGDASAARYRECQQSPRVKKRPICARAARRCRTMRAGLVLAGERIYREHIANPSHSLGREPWVVFCWTAAVTSVQSLVCGCARR